MLDLLAVSAPLSPLSAQASPVGLAVRLALLAEAWLFCRDRPARLGVVTALFVASLAWQVTVLLLVPVAVGASILSRGRPPRRAVVLVAVGAIGLALGASRRPGETPPPPDDPALASAWWLGRDNLWRAHEAALRWASSEHDAPGRGFVALAEIDWRLGDREKAARVLRKVLEGARDPEARAEQLERQWKEPR